MFDITDIKMGGYTAEQWQNGDFHESKNLFSTAVDVVGFGIGPGDRTAAFTPIIPMDGQPTNPDKNVIVRLINERQRNPKGINDLLDYDNLQAENSRVCPNTEELVADHIRKRAKEGSSAGMPYGLPPLSDQQVNTLTQWIREGAKLPKEGQLPAAINAGLKTDKGTIKTIEKFFNGGSLEQKLVSRYIYEHLFLSHIYLSEDNKSGQFYNLVRSATSCEDRANIKVLVTRRPWDEVSEKEEIEEAFYCLRPIDETITHKDHITYLMDSDKIKRYKEIFFKWEKWSTKSQPSRKNKYASNPFKTFNDIPVRGRYQFMLDDAQHFIMSFIRGPVCRGNSSTNSIDEQFYVMFLNPESDPMVLKPDFYKEAARLLDLPAKIGSEQIFIGKTYWFGKTVRENRNKYRELRMKTYKQIEAENKSQGYDFNDIWMGNAEYDYKVPNKNSNLTVFRNFDSATVVQGFVGPTSKTMFVVDYSIFERLYYLLVAGYDVYADLNHHLHSRLYMSYLRSESEEIFLNFLPSKVRRPMRNSWNIPSRGLTERLYVNDVDVIHPMIGNDYENANPFFKKFEEKLSAKLSSAGKSLDKILARGNEDILLLAEANLAAQPGQNTVTLVKKKTDRFPKIRSQNGLKLDDVVTTIFKYDINKRELHELNRLLAEYRIAFANKLKGLFDLAGTRGYVDDINLDSNRYPIYTQTSVKRPVITSEASTSIEGFEKGLSQIMAHPAKNTPWVLKAPSTTMLLVEDGEKSYIYSLVRQKEHYNVNPIFGEDFRRHFDEDTVIAYRGVLGSYPSYFFHIKLSEGQDFLQSVSNLEAPTSNVKKVQRTEKLSQSYINLVRKYGRPRSGRLAGKFWPTYDKIVDTFLEQEPITGGYLDLNRYGIDYRNADSRLLLNQ